VVPIELRDTAAAFFQLDAQTILGVHLDNSIITVDSPARPGELVTLYAGGLGPLDREYVDNVVPLAASWIRDRKNFRMLFNGVDIDSSRIQYVGVTPFWAGLYQINVRLPDNLGADPEVRIGFRDRLSPPNLSLPVR
jgi:uncharacterized protein (TIGR03437 family)